MAALARGGLAVLIRCALMLGKCLPPQILALLLMIGLDHLGRCAQGDYQGRDADRKSEKA